MRNILKGLITVMMTAREDSGEVSKARIKTHKVSKDNGMTKENGAILVTGSIGECAVLTREQLEQLAQFDTPTISNAVEFFNLRPKTQGFMSPEIKSMLPIEKPMVGYACTVKVSASNSPTSEQMAMWMDYYKKIHENQGPVIAVVQDIDPVPVGSFWGEVNATTHKALGCIGTITQGGVRDLNEVNNFRFGYFASCILVSHAYIHIEEFDCPVEVGGMTVYPGDLIHADKHGAIVIPKEIAPKLAEACRMAAYAEEPVIWGGRKAIESGQKVDLEELRQWRSEMMNRKKASIAEFSK